MTIDEAIGRLKEMPESPTIVCDNQDFEAIGLGKEALKRIYNNRATTPGFNFILLPGETEETRND